ncbi:MAG: diaminopimelate epimerase [Candidatus Omnitrophota bacterium]|nr:diaminopimelate epimerase [Candidatus Omnitrophota bacterium]
MIQKTFTFTKMVASGNDFIVLEVRSQKSEVRNLKDLAKKMCDRKFGIGADGLLVLEKSRKADIKMRIFNADGSEAEMCGNGARCAAYYLSQNVSLRAPKGRSNLKIETKAGVIESIVKGNNIKINLTEPSNLKLDIPIGINNRLIKVNFINTGVPHAVIFVEGLDQIDVASIGSKIRYHRKFIPVGTNVDFMEILSKDSIKVRTYERGVEDETLACGTGSVAAALIFALKTVGLDRINVNTESGDTLKVYFKKEKNKFSDVWLEGKAGIVYKGEYYV